MLKMAHLLKFLTELNPHTSPIRLALYNYIKAFHTADEPLTANFFESFFCHMLDYSHWLSNKSHLGHEVALLLKNFNGFYQNKLDISEVKFPENIQVFEVENSKDCEDLLKEFLVTTYGPNAQIKLQFDQKRWFAFVLSENHKLSVFQLDKKFIIRHGQLSPLRKNLLLEYDANIELLPEAKFTFEISPHHIAQFQVKNERVSGVITRGYMFQKIQEFTDAKIHEVPRLFWALKRAEQFFITRDSDPFYQDLSKKLHDITQGIWEKNSESWQNYMSILLSQSDSALENVYIGDKTLEELVLKVRQILTSEKSEVCTTIQPKTTRIQPLNPMTRTRELG